MTAATRRAAAMRDDFDRGFAAPLRPPELAHSDYLCIRVAGEPCAVAVADVSSLHADLHIAQLPSRATELVGVAAIRGVLVPIYHLAIALGGAPGPARWTVLMHAGSTGFSVDGYDGHVRVPDSSFAAAAARGHVRGQLAVAGQARTVIDLGSVLTALEARWRPPATNP